MTSSANVVGKEDIAEAFQWTGTAPYLGADMFWDHADTATYLRWLRAARLMPVWSRYVPEGDSGHTLVLAKSDTLKGATG